MEDKGTHLLGIVPARSMLRVTEATTQEILRFCQLCCHWNGYALNWLLQGMLDFL